MIKTLLIISMFPMLLLSAVSASAQTGQNFPSIAHPKTEPVETDDEIAALLCRNKYKIDFEAGELKAEGADFLAREAAASQFFFIGENHGIAEVPQFAQTLFRRIEKSGYKYLAVETGYLPARVITEPAVKENDAQSFVVSERRVKKFTYFIKKIIFQRVEIARFIGQQNID